VSEGDVVLDYHAGSGTTGHAVLDLEEDGVSRHFILCEQMDYAESLTAKRIEKVIKKIKAATSSTAN